MIDMAKAEKVKEGLAACFMIDGACSTCPYFAECYPLQGESKHGLPYKDTVALIDELTQEIEQLRQHPDVVRCKDCDFGNTCRNGKGELAVECRKPGGTHTELHEPGWFCADGWKGGGT